MSKFVKIGKKRVAVEDVIMIKPVMVSDTLFREVRYRQTEPCYAEFVELLPYDEGYKVELEVRRGMEKINRHFG